jgi:hypothetical protein
LKKGVEIVYAAYDKYANKFFPYDGKRNGFIDGKCYLLVSYESLKEKVKELQEQFPGNASALDLLLKSIADEK